MKKYKTILADPPYKYGQGWGWGAGKYYKLMKIEEICNLPIKDLADKNAHLYLWSPNAMVPKALEIMKKWGFRYVTMITWVKHRSIFGYYFKGQTEQLLFGVKGKLAPMDRKQTTVIFDKILRHSQKPYSTYKIIEKVSPTPYLELFAREKVEGWTSLGYDINGKGIKEALQEMTNG